MAASASDSGGATAVPTALDPCQLVTKDEAGALAGTSFGAGKESSSGNTKICTYGGQTTNVFMVDVAQAPDEATAKAAEAAAQADLEAAAKKVAAQGFTITQLPGFAPGADAVVMSGKATVQGVTVSGGAIYVLRGTTFFGFSDLALGGSAPTPDALKAQAMTTLGKLP